MAKPTNAKQSKQPNESAQADTTEPTGKAKEKPDDSVSSKRPVNNPVKDTAATNRSKKGKAPSSKQGSLMPSEHKLENLAAAIAAAGDADNLLLILNHVDAAGGPADVIESIEAYRALKTAVEQPADESEAAS